MRAQFRRLVNSVTPPHVTLQIILFSSGAHAGMSGALVLMDFSDPMDTDLIHNAPSVVLTAGSNTRESDTMKPASHT